MLKAIVFNRKAIYSALVVSILFYCPKNEVESPYAKLKEHISKNVLESGQLDPTIEFEGKSYEVGYTIKKNYQKFLDRLLRRHVSDYAVAVVVDNESGNILGIGSYSKKEKKKVPELAFASTHPSASLVKIVSVANLVENSAVNINSDIVFQGRGTTLYKYQLTDKYRWPRRMSLERAFAMSNNPAIAKATINNTKANDFISTANKFGYNQEVTNFLEIPRAVIPFPQSQFHFAELSSGFNVEALTNPLHAAYLPFLVANNGIARKLKLVDRVIGADGVVHHGVEKINDSSPVFNQATIAQLKSAMGRVVERGTGSRIRRRLKRRVKEVFNIGGKTGSLTGGLPFGKRDWFVGYAMPKDKSSKGISFAVMHINQKKWYTRSTFIAKNIIEYYYRIYKNDQERVALK